LGEREREKGIIRVRVSVSMGGSKEME